MYPNIHTFIYTYVYIHYTFIYTFIYHKSDTDGEI